MEQPRQRIFTNKQLLALVIPIFMEQMLGILVGLIIQNGGFGAGSGFGHGDNMEEKKKKGQQD